MSHMLPQFARHIGHIVASSLILIVIIIVVAAAVVVIVTKLDFFFFFFSWDKLDNGHKLPRKRNQFYI